MITLFSEALRGLRIGAPLIVGYVPVAFAFGILGEVSGLPAWVTIGLSLLVYGGASQFAALALLSTGAGLASIILTTFIINLRHVLLAASIAPKLQGMNIWEKSWFSVELTDEAFAVHDARYRTHPERSKTEIFVTNGSVHASWVLGTGLGILFGGAIPSLSDYGLEFALTAMFIGILFVEVMRTAHDLLVAFLSGVLAVLITLLGYSMWATVLATTVAATVGWWIQSKTPSTSDDLEERNARR